MAVVQLREFTSGAELMAHYAAIRGRRLAVVAPPDKVAPQPIAASVSQPVAVVKNIKRPVIYLRSDEWFPTDGAVRSNRAPTGAEIIRAVCWHYRVTKPHLLSQRRSYEVCRPRQVAMFLMKELSTGLSLPAIGRLLGNRDHTTILSGVRKIDGLRKHDPVLQHTLTLLQNELMPPPAVDPNQIVLPFAGEGG